MGLQTLSLALKRDPRCLFYCAAIKPIDTHQRIQPADLVECYWTLTIQLQCETVVGRNGYEDSLHFINNIYIIKFRLKYHKILLYSTKINCLSSIVHYTLKIELEGS